MPKWKLSFCLVPLLFLALAGRAEAACGSEHRVSDEDSECMTEWHDNNRYRASNYCSHAIKIKVDVQSGSDVTRDIPRAGKQGASTISGDIGSSWVKKIRSVTCCKDAASCNHE